MNKKIKIFLNFITYDIWRVSEAEVTHAKFSFYNIIKTIILAVRRFTTDRITDKASALTYSTLLSIVPLLAILFAIARGFGFDHMMEEQVRSGLGSQEVATETILNFVESYLKQTKSGIFVGVGLVLLLWTVVNLTANIELTFNNIWQVKKQRTLYRKITDYFSMFLLLPILIVVSGGLTIFMSTMIKSMEGFVVLAPVMKVLVRMIPFILTWFMFTALYIFMPNTKVKFKHAFISGIIVGTTYQAFQFLYINGQISVTKYNAIYGSFAAIPLFLLWLQISWTICLFGAELTYAGQNIRNFNFEKDAKNISRRYRDFLSILIMSIICKRFEKGEMPYSAEEISLEYRIPIRLTNRILGLLQEINLVHETIADTKSENIMYLPSIDINKINVALLLERIDTNGSEDFKIDKEEEFRNHWHTLLESRDLYQKRNSEILLKDL
ncbi:YihY/virulence factor BrkB family protein [uncultured Bacteroides sp.]|uniref:YihY/virulence factor BrkB family protein n=1 Tax=uncultured Bacteroides sp. TaxID=162156 RepID=UPI002AAB9A30|nr:YihY/virulence factor BrkB family protein [uncultured Bacteroides sp.]